MTPSKGYDHRDGTSDCAKTGPTGHHAAPMTSSAGHLVLGGEVVTGYSGHPHGADQASSERDVDVNETTSCSESDSDEPPLAMLIPPSPVHNPSTPPCHFYVDVSNVDDSTHEAIRRHVPIDRDFQANLEQEQEGGDFSTFLALPEIIPARKKRCSNPYWISRNQKFSPPVHIAKVVNV